MLQTKAEVKKKKNVCKRNKKNWRKYISTKDVDDFLDQKRLEERIGGPVKERKDDDLFVIDTNTNLEHSILETEKLSKKDRAKLPPTCLKLLEPLTAVPDPITKRNRVRTKEERKCAVRKCFEGYKRSQGIIPKKEQDSKKQRLLTLKKKKAVQKEHVFNKDVWEESESNEVKENEWLDEDTVRHTLTNTNRLKVKVPKNILTKKSVLPPIENPHPGTSYNPSYQEHQALLKLVEEKERERMKQDAHIKRVTTDAFCKIPAAERDKNWIEEMTQGLVKEEPDVKEESEENQEKAPTKPPKMKTKKQRRKQKEQKKMALERKYAKVEKKKTADIYKLRFIAKDIAKVEETYKKNQERRQRKEIAQAGKTKRLSVKRFEEPDLDFNRRTDIRGNLRNIKREGNLLVDRFYSLQKRNILRPSTKQLPMKRAKVKKFIKASHKIDLISNS